MRVYIYKYQSIHMCIYVHTGKKRTVYTKNIHAETGSNKIREKNENKAKKQRRKKITSTLKLAARENLARCSASRICACGRSACEGDKEKCYMYAICMYAILYVCYMYVCYTYVNMEKKKK
jgi:hypothetical protein